jgi:hypothetical protein
MKRANRKLHLILEPIRVLTDRESHAAVGGADVSGSSSASVCPGQSNFSYCPRPSAPMSVTLPNSVSIGGSQPK